jgi:hypothetical protein
MGIKMLTPKYNLVQELLIAELRLKLRSSRWGWY